jgi:AcrR family transcriptional regulator
MDARQDPPPAGGHAGGTAQSSGAAPGRALRRDAERNRERILKAAADVFTERGLEASLDDVARRAGVGVGTVYRRFPSKTTLADAMFEERIDALVLMAEQAHAEPDPWTGLVAFLTRAAEMLAGDRGLRQMLMFAAYGHDRVGYARDRMRPAVARLLERAQAAGQVRADLAPTDVPIMEFMLGAIAEYAGDVRPTIWRRYLALMLDALRPARDAPSPLSEPELTPDEMVGVLHSNPVGRRLARKAE